MVYARGVVWRGAAWGGIARLCAKQRSVAVIIVKTRVLYYRNISRVIAVIDNCKRIATVACMCMRAIFRELTHRFLFGKCMTNYRRSCS